MYVYLGDTYSDDYVYVLSCMTYFIIRIIAAFKILKCCRLFQNPNEFKANGARIKNSQRKYEISGNSVKKVGQFLKNGF